MNHRNAPGRFLGLAALMTATAFGGTGCNIPRTDDINRVQPGFVKKSIFQTGDQWHYRRTIADSETTNAIVVEGSGDIWIDRVVFEIQEDFLIARKPYASLPGIGLDAVEGADGQNGPILAQWPITSHFDIIRGYDALTGQETNQIVENTVDRPWHERDYMRVNFAANEVEGSFLGSYAFGWSPIQFNSTGSFWTNLETNPTDVYASRFSDDYIEITDRTFLGMDVITCWSFGGRSRVLALDSCGFGEAQLRHSFKRITEENDFEPRFYPDSFVVKDANGDPVVDDLNNEVEREGIYGRFGVFRLATPTYDRGYGFTEEGRQWRAMLFDIWEDSVDANGLEIPYAERTEKPIIYYLNAEYPDRYREVARQVAADYNRVFKGMVADLKGLPETEVMDMFEIRDNDCNEANIIQTVLADRRLVSAVERAVCPQGELCSLPRGDDLADAMALRLGIGNLKRTCTSLEAATKDPITGKSSFDWQRIGDVRHNMVVYLNNPQRSGWGGYGPMHADATTGESVAATSFLRGAYYEISAATIADYICFMNEEDGCDTEDIIYGKDVRRQVGRIEDQIIDMATTPANDAMVAELTRRMSAVGATSMDALPEDRSGRTMSNRFDRLEGTNIERSLMDDTMLTIMSNGEWIPGTPPPQELLEDATLTNLWEDQRVFSQQNQQRRNNMAAGGFCFLEQDLDPHWAGLALDLRDMTRQERFQEIANRLMKHVMLHELGHNVGLAHNFEGTYDALNYNPRFWENVQGTPEQQVQANLDEFRHTTVMEYMSAKGLFADFLGSYDEAALRFAYGNQVQVFTSPSVQVEGGADLKNWRYYNDYRAIPDYLCGGDCGDQSTRMDVLTSRDWVDFDPQNPPVNEVPYLFCDGFYNRRTPFCATFDYGSNLLEIQANYYRMWKNYFPFTNFARGRLSPYGWNLGSAFTAIQLVWDFYDVTQQYFQIMTAEDPTFQGTDLQADMAGVMLNSMNIATEVIALPDEGRYCPLAGFTAGQKPVYLDSLQNGCDPELDINDPQIQDLEAFDLPVGPDARPLGLAFTNELEERDIRFVGSVFDKRITAIFLGASNPRLFRFNYQVDRRNFMLSPYRLFEPEMRTFYNNLVQLDGFITTNAAETLSSHWCRDPSAPERADFGYLEARRMFDMEAASLDSFPEASPSCLNPAYIYPSNTLNLSDWAIIAGHLVLSSDIDARLDMGQELKIWAVGAYDEPSYLTTDNFPRCLDSNDAEDCLCEYVDDLTGVIYRGLNRVADGRGSIACDIIDQTQARYERYLGLSGSPGAFDTWRFAVEKLEFNRELYRIFQDR
ncbi:MAG: zinc-dependent metalloprotease [Myxococcota bacterium]